MLEVDLNLLRVLDALLDTGSVTGTAKRLHLSPPAVSRSLGRLRRTLGDPLFVRAGREMVPTEFALSLRVPTRNALGAVLDVLRPVTPSDPIRFDRRFVIAAEDAIVAVLALPLMEKIRARAPGVDVDFLPDDPDAITRFRAADLDLRIGVHVENHHDTTSEVLLTDRFVAAVRDNHPLLDRRLTAKRFAEAHHVTVSPRGKRIGPIDDALAALGLAREHVTTVTSFVVASHLVAMTDLVGSLPRTVVTAMSRVLPIRAVEIPLAIPTFEVCLTWHQRSSGDPAHEWFRQQVTEVLSG